MSRAIDHRITSFATLVATAARTSPLLLTAALMLLFAGAGCQSDPTGGHGDEFFLGETGGRSVNQFTQAQAASGARKDATLRAVHFDGDRLNSLGREKLDLMLATDNAASAQPASPVVIWIDADEEVAVRRGRDVAAYLSDHKGLKPSQFQFKTGENPDNFGPVAPNLARMERTESTGAADSTMEPDASQSSSQGSAAGTMLQ